ncbi:MAG: HNH endonuclease [Rhodospirillaceae bacterium]|nr:HNH endonuclease [Rhodospirillaceae bacterium]MYK57766.1 HNH endonuclease [Rhodospirillaceae bacterium]
MPSRDIDPRILALCEKVTAKRPRTVIDHIIEHGHVTTEELQSLYGYDHPPRAVRDVRESGIPIQTFRVRSEKTSRMIAAYRFDSPDRIVRGRIGGRKAFSKRFHAALVDRYGARDAITGERCEARYLQIDHRVPYEVAGDTAHDESRPEEYMLLDGSSQRAKSWSCEQCPNWRDTRDESVCRSCFWAWPESYTHIAGEHVRRVDIEWRGAEVEVFERLRKRAEKADTTIAAFIKRLLRKAVE